MNEEQLTWVNQGRDEIIIEAAPDRIYSILENSQRLPDWMPAVKHTNGGCETLGSVRKCNVNFEGRDGFVVECCVVCDRPRRIGWHLLEDSLGFSGMLKFFTFDFVLEPFAPNRTRVIHTSYFEPRNWFARMMIALVVRRKFRSLRQTVLANIKRISEGEEQSDVPRNQPSVAGSF